MNGLNIFKHEFLYTAYADNTTFFLKDRKSIIELMSDFNTFSRFPGLKPNNTKCEFAGIGVLNGVQVYEVRWRTNLALQDEKLIWHSDIKLF